MGWLVWNLFTHAECVSRNFDVLCTYHYGALFQIHREDKENEDF